MAKVLVTESYLQNIADAIRAKNGQSTEYLPSEMAEAVRAIETGITPTGTKSITANGTHDVTNYASAEVAVPNSYAADDEGKVVSNGALVAQTAQTVTENGTYDTTLKNSVVVNVSSGGGDEGLIPVQLTFANGCVADGNNFSATYDGFCLRVIGRIEFTKAFSADSVIISIPSQYRVLSGRREGYYIGTQNYQYNLRITKDGDIKIVKSVSNGQYAYLCVSLYASDQGTNDFVLLSNVSDFDGCRYMKKNGVLIGELSIKYTASSGAWKKIFQFQPSEVINSFALIGRYYTNALYGADTFVDTSDNSGNVFVSQSNTEINILVIGRYTQ